MKQTFNIRSVVGQLQLQPQTTRERQEVRRARPFFIMVLLIMGIIFGYALFTIPLIRQPLRLLPFSLLILLHGYLHWHTPILVHRPTLGLPILMLQGLLAFAISLITEDPILSFVLFMMLIGETIGVLKGVRQVATAIIFQLTLAAVRFVWDAGWEGLPAWWLTVLPITGFIILYVSLFARQTEARAQAEALLEELEQAHRQLAEYATQVEDLTLTAERERLARELHDTLAQGLAGLILQLEAVDSHLETERPGRAQEIVQQAMTRARATLTESRRVIDDLRAAQGEPESLVEAIGREVRRFGDATGIPFTLEAKNVPALSQQVSEQARRIIAEGLSNVVRHARAEHASVGLSFSDGLLTITISDDGVGFEAIAQAPKQGHYGLIGMRERARLVDGTFNVESQPGQGTLVTVELPANRVVEEMIS